MGKVELHISSDIASLIAKVNELDTSVKKLTTETDTYTDRAAAGYSKEKAAVGALSAEIKAQEKIIKDMEREAEKMLSTHKKMTLAQEASYKRLTSDIAVAKKELTELQKKQEQVNTTSTNGMAIFKKLGGVIAGAFSVYAVINFAKASMAAYQDQLRIEAKLHTALKGRESVVKALIRQASELKRITLFDDEAIKNAQAILAINVKDEEQLKKLTAVTLDLAQAKNIDLATAATSVNMATTGQARALKSLGIELDLTGTKSENIILILNALNKAVGGQAVAALTEEEKAIRGVNVSLDDFKKAWGGMLLSMSQSLPLEKFSEGMDYMSWRLNKFRESEERGWWTDLWLERFLQIGEFRYELYKLDSAVAGNTKIWEENAKILGLVAETYASLVNHSSEAQETVINVTKLTVDELLKQREILVDRYGDLEDEKNKELFDSLNKEIKYRKEHEDKLKQLSVEAAKIAKENIEGFTDIVNQDLSSLNSSIDKTEENLKDFSDVISQDFGALNVSTESDIKAIEDNIKAFEAQMIKSWDEMQKFANDHPLWASLGFTDDEQLDAARDMVDEISNLITDIVDQQVEASERLVDDLNQRIDEQGELVEREFEMKQEGLANNYEVEQENLKQMQVARDQAIKDREKNIQIQRTLSTVESGISLIVAAANIMKGFSEIPIVGVILGIAAVGAMLASFLIAKDQATAATQFEEGGLLTGKKHSEGGIRIPGTNIEVEGDEYITNRSSTKKYLPLLEAINMDDKQGMKIFFDRQFINKMPQSKIIMKDIDDSKRLGEIVRELKKGKAEVIYGNGFIVEKIGGYTKRINLN